jgi:hypothetical protein
VPPGGSAMLANRNPIWYQSSRVIPQGSLTYDTDGGNAVGANGLRFSIAI